MKLGTNLPSHFWINIAVIFAHMIDNLPMSDSRIYVHLEAKFRSVTNYRAINILKIPPPLLNIINIHLTLHILEDSQYTTPTIIKLWRELELHGSGTICVSLNWYLPPRNPVDVNGRLCKPDVLWTISDKSHMTSYFNVLIVEQLVVFSIHSNVMYM